MITPNSIAFDIDGVVADTMALFIDIAKNEFHVNHIRYEDITSYSLEECINIDLDLIEAIIIRLLDKKHTRQLEPIDGAPYVLSRLVRHHSPILFVTARDYVGPIYDWIQKNILPDADPSSIEVIATGSFDAKTDVLLNRGISYFVEDRLETCFQINESGITPVLFKQPWNRRNHPFMEVSNWSEIESLIQF